MSELSIEKLNKEIRNWKKNRKGNDLSAAWNIFFTQHPGTLLNFDGKILMIRETKEGAVKNESIQMLVIQALSEGISVTTIGFKGRYTQELTPGQQD